MTTSTRLRNGIRRLLLTLAVPASLALSTGCGSSSQDSSEITLHTANPKRDTRKLGPRDLTNHVTLEAAIAAGDLAVQPPAPPTPQPALSEEAIPGPNDAVKVEKKTKTIVVGPGVTITVPSGNTLTPPVAPPPPPAVAAKPDKPVTIVKRVVPAIKVRVKSDMPHSSEDAALSDAVEVAQLEVVRQLQKLDPPIGVKPSLPKVRSEYIKLDTKQVLQPTATDVETFKKSGLDPQRVWVEVDVELSTSQVQQLRRTERVTDTARAGGFLFAVILAIYGFLRLDAWTKGYLTGFLGLGAIGLVIGAVIFFLRSA
ncbi:MAG: hypothetical protein ACRCZF_08940 [Gemmataceae bacterium]